MKNSTSPLHDLIYQVLAPLIAADGGQIRLVEQKSDRVVLELGGSCTGCPGLYYTRTHVVEPALRKIVGPDVRIEIRSSSLV